MYRQNPEVKHFLPMVQFLITNNLTNKEDLLKEMEDIVEKFERRDRIEFMVKYAIYLWWLKNKNEEIKRKYELKLDKIIFKYETGPHRIFPHWKQVKDLFEHYVDQGKIQGYNALANASWANKGASQLWNELESIQADIQDKLEEKNKSKILARADQGVTMIKFDNGWRWTYLDNYKDEEEALLMDHCGTGEFGEDGRLLSLRDENNMPQITAAVLPLVNNKEQSLFILGQIKGKKNSKPDFGKFGIFLETLYRDPRIVWATNYSLDDFNFRKYFPEIENDKPGLFALHNNNPKIKQLIIQSEIRPEYLKYRDILDKIFPNILASRWIINRFYYIEKNQLEEMDIDEIKDWLTDVLLTHAKLDLLDVLEEDFNMVLELFHKILDQSNNKDELLEIAQKISQAAVKNKQGMLSSLKDYLSDETIKNLYITDEYLYLTVKPVGDIYLGELTYEIGKALKNAKPYNAKKLWKTVEKIVFNYYKK